MPFSQLFPRCSRRLPHDCRSRCSGSRGEQRDFDQFLSALHDEADFIDMVDMRQLIAQRLDGCSDSSVDEQQQIIRFESGFLRR